MNDLHKEDRYCSWCIIAIYVKNISGDEREYIYIIYGDTHILQYIEIHCKNDGELLYMILEYFDYSREAFSSIIFLLCAVDLILNLIANVCEGRHTN